MAGRGPEPKPKDKRRNASPPQRGEWVNLPPLVDRVLPELPARDDGWMPRTGALWAAWSDDPVTSTFGPSEVAAAVEVAFLHDDYVRDPSAARIAEIRQWTDRLGLNPKGKRDLRYRLVDAPERTADADSTDEVAQRREERRKRHAV